MRYVEGRTTLIVTYVILAFAALIALMPLALMVVNAFKPSVEIIANPLSLPSNVKWENFTNAWDGANLGSSMWNSVQVTGMTVLLVCATAPLTAYVLARKAFKGWQVVTIYLLAATTAPIQLFLFPLYFIFARMGLVNSPIAVAFIYCALFSPFAIFLLRTYFLAVPIELEEAARVDGATSWQIYTKVLLPIVSPGILTIALIVGLNCWNEFLIASTFLSSERNMTAITAFFNLSGQYTSDWGMIMAAALIIILPIVVLFVFLQRRFIEGMTGGSLKA